MSTATDRAPEAKRRGLSLATRLFLAEDGLVSLDPTTSARHVVVARRDRLQD